MILFLQISQQETLLGTLNQQNNKIFGEIQDVSSQDEVHSTALGIIAERVNGFEEFLSGLENLAWNADSRLILISLVVVQKSFYYSTFSTVRVSQVGGAHRRSFRQDTQCNVVSVAMAPCLCLIEPRR